MTPDELRAEYVACVKILRAEKAMRDRVFSRAEPSKAIAKVGEMDRVLRLLETMKNLAKTELEVQQASLFEKSGAPHA